MPLLDLKMAPKKAPEPSFIDVLGNMATIATGALVGGGLGAIAGPVGAAIGAGVGSSAARGVLAGGASGAAAGGAGALVAGGVGALGLPAAVGGAQAAASAAPSFTDLLAESGAQAAGNFLGNMASYGIGSLLQKDERQGATLAPPKFRRPGGTIRGSLLRG